MPKEHILLNEIVAEHRERMLNLKKYYPFFKLSETSFSWYKDGIYESLDMGYILMAVLRFFIEENNFNEQDVTYTSYYQFMCECIKRDFGIDMPEEDKKVIINYIFDKLKNEGRPFTFQYYDPVDKIKKTTRVRLILSRIQDGTVWYSISSEGIEFYLDTKEIRDESKISVEQLLLEKMIESKDFKGGTQVIKRINGEVKRLERKKSRVMDILSLDVYAGVEAYEEFFETGIRWFADEQKLFVKNKELIETILNRARNEQGSNVAEIYNLDTELKIAMNNHSRLLRACTELGIRTDEVIKKAKLNRLRNRFDFVSAQNRMIQKDNPALLEHMVKPFLGLYIRKTFDFAKVEHLLSYRPKLQEKVEVVEDENAQEIVFQDELDSKRFAANTSALLQILFGMIQDNEEITLSRYNDRVHGIFGENIDSNGDYFTFLVHLCGKKEYFIGTDTDAKETFLDQLIDECMKKPQFAQYMGLHFVLDFEHKGEPIAVGSAAVVTDFTIRRI